MSCFLFLGGGNRSIVFTLVMMDFTCPLPTVGLKLSSVAWQNFTSTKINSRVDFICINIPVSPAYGVYISQLIRYSRACVQHSEFQNRAQLLMQRLHRQGYVAPKLKSSLQKLYCRHRNLVVKWQWIFYFLNSSFLSFITAKTFTRLDCIQVTRRVSYQKQELLTIREHPRVPLVCWWGSCCSSF